jgi:hypothetical protein
MPTTVQTFFSGSIKQTNFQGPALVWRRPSASSGMVGNLGQGEGEGAAFFLSLSWKA